MRVGGLVHRCVSAMSYVDNDGLRSLTIWRTVDWRLALEASLPAVHRVPYA